jgi:hypothetical protein
MAVPVVGALASRPKIVDIPFIRRLLQEAERHPGRVSQRETGYHPMMGRISFFRFGIMGAVAAVVVGAGCAPCREGTVRVELAVGDDIAPVAARVHVVVMTASDVVETDAALRGGSRRTVDALLAHYREGILATVSATAYDENGVTLASTSRRATLSAGCEVVELPLGNASQSSDGGSVPTPDRVPVPIVGGSMSAAANTVDILLVIDDSPSMGAEQAELRARLPTLFRELAALAAKGLRADYHIGVVTTDLGAGDHIDMNCRPGGLGGRLQRVGRQASPGCPAPTDGSFLRYNQLLGTSNVPAGSTLEATLGCMAAVGEVGCGFEQPLEAAYRALHDNIAENVGFLRPDGILVVLFITDEDDCSAEPMSDLFVSPSAPPPSGIGYRTSYRCTRFGVVRDGARGPELMPYGSSGGPVSNPRPATLAQGGRLIEVDKYVRYFTTPRANGGVMSDPSRVLLASLAGPATPVQSLLANPTSTSTYSPCPGPISETCQPVLDRSCVSNMFVGDPAVRLNAVIEALPPTNRASLSICNPTYDPMMSALSAGIAAALGGAGACFPGVLDDPANPDCVVEDVVEGQAIALPRCGSPDDLRSCWRVVSRSVIDCIGICAKEGDSPQRYAIEIVRRTPIVPGTITRAACRLRPVPSPAPICAGR